jgi:hypothetical protein
VVAVAAERAERLYRFDPLDESGVFLGLGLIQCVLVGGGLVAGVGLVSVGIPILAAAIPVVVGTALSFARIGGYVAWEWIPLGATWLWMRFGRGRRWHARLPLLTGDGDIAPPLPPCLAGLDIVAVPWRAGQIIGAVRDKQAATLTALLPAAGPEFLTRSRSEQEQLLAGWADVLGQFAPERSPVLHLGWSDSARQSGLRQHVEWLDSTERGDRNDDAHDSYRELLEGAASQASSHEVLLFLTVSRERLGRRAATSDPEAAAARALGSAIDALQRGLRNASLVADNPLTPAEVRKHLRTRIDPVTAIPRAVNGRLVERLGLVAPGAEGPLHLDTAWRQLHTDGAVHRTYWVVGFPRLPQHPAWLEPFLAGNGITRTLTVFFRPVAPHQSRRRIERDLVKLESDAQTREDKGRRVDARHRRATQALLDREEELVAGYAEMGHLALVCVSASDSEQLDDDCEVIEQLARETGIELRLLDARQDLAWAASLPFGLAPRHLLA